MESLGIQKPIALELNSVIMWSIEFDESGEAFDDEDLQRIEGTVVWAVEKNRD